MSKKIIHAALLGLGTVGTGVYKVLKSQEEEMEQKIGAAVAIKKILVRNLKKAAAKTAGAGTADRQLAGNSGG